MTRMFCIPGIVFLFIAFVLSFLVSISLPYLTALDIVRTHFDGASVNGNDNLREVRFGLWAQCEYETNGDKTCGEAHSGGYTVSVRAPEKDVSIVISPSWTRGLAVHPIATAVTFLALCFSFSTHLTVTLISSLLSFLAAAIMLIAFAIDIALYARVHHEMGKLPNVGEDTNTGPGFWMTFVSLILLLLAGCTVCFGRRRARMSDASPSYPMTSTKRPFWQRFRRN